MVMKTLVKKELRECLAPVLILGLIWLCLIGFYIRTIDQYNLGDYSGLIRQLEPGTQASDYALYHKFAVPEFGPWLLCLSGLLGLSLAGVQFWMPLWTRTWGFLIHRACSKNQILVSKLLTGLLIFIIVMGLPWMFLVNTCERLKDIAVPGNPRIVWEGWLYILIGFSLYLGAALSALRSERWYTTRLFPMAFPVLLLAATVSWVNLFISFAILATGLALLVLMLNHTFSWREF
jgi:hypothetical protein